MSTLILKSPAKCTLAVHFPDIKFTKLVVRVEDGTGAVVIFKVHETEEVTAANADGFLKSGEAYEFNGLGSRSAKNITILQTAGDPNVYWHLE